MTVSQGPFSPFDLNTLEYLGGGYFRVRGPRGALTDVLHGAEVLRVADAEIKLREEWVAQVRQAIWLVRFDLRLANERAQREHDIATAAESALEDLKLDCAALIARLDHATAAGVAKPGGGDAWPELAVVREQLDGQAP